MTEPEYPVPEEQFQSRSAMVRTLGAMPGWKRKLLGFSLVIGLVGLGGEAASALKARENPPAVSSTADSSAKPAAPGGQSALPRGSSGFVSDQPSTPSDNSANTPTARGPDTAAPAQNPGLAEKVTPWMRRFGLSFFVGIVLGVIFRTFIKLAAGVTVLIAGIFLALSYFHILNIDMTNVKTEYASASAWLVDQASRLKGVVFHALPSSTTAAAGFFTGFKRR